MNHLCQERIRSDTMWRPQAGGLLLPPCIMSLFCCSWSPAIDNQILTGSALSCTFPCWGTALVVAFSERHARCYRNGVSSNRVQLLDAQGHSERNL